MYKIFWVFPHHSLPIFNGHRNCRAPSHHQWSTTTTITTTTKKLALRMPDAYQQKVWAPLAPIGCPAPRISVFIFWQLSCWCVGTAEEGSYSSLTEYCFVCGKEQGVSKKNVLSWFLPYFSFGGRILLFQMCFGIRILSPFHLATQTIDQVP